MSKKPNGKVIELNRGSVTVTSTKKERDRLKRYAKLEYGSVRKMAKQIKKDGGFSAGYYYHMINGKRNIPAWLLVRLDLWIHDNPWFEK